MITNQYTGEMYLTRRETEFMGLPVGNAFRGAPFKQKEMPFFIAPAIASAAGAIAAVGTAAAGVGALAGLGTAIGATVVAIGTVAAVAGTAMTVVGAVTGDKDLMKIGGIVGLAGGVGAMATGGIMAASAGGSFFSGMGSLGQAGVQTAMSAQTTAAASTGALGINAALNSTPQAVAQAQAAANSSVLSSATGGSSLSQSVNGMLASGGTSGLAPTVQSIAPASVAAPTVQSIAPVMTPIGQASTLGADGAVKLAANTAGGGFFESATSGIKGLFDGWSTSDKLMAVGVAAPLLKGFGDDDQERQIQANLEIAKLNADTNIKQAEMQVGIADRRLAAEKEVNAQKAENMNFQPTMTWTTGNKKTGESKTLGSGSVISGAK